MLENFKKKYNLEEAQAESEAIKEMVNSGKAKDYAEAEKLHERAMLQKAFEAQNNLDFIHSITTKELFEADEEGKRDVETRADLLPESLRDAAYFRIAKLCYENEGNLPKALLFSEKISNPDEYTRCLVHVANAVLDHEMDVAKAESIIQKVKKDSKGYLSYFEKEKARTQELLKQK